MMNKTERRIILGILTLAIVSGIGDNLNSRVNTINKKVSASVSQNYEGKKPKYIFMFIGDGMSFPQIQVTEYFNGVKSKGPINASQGNYPTNEKLSFMNLGEAFNGMVLTSSYSHTGIPVTLMAKGVGQEMFNGYYDNTDVFKKLKEITKVD